LLNKITAANEQQGAGWRVSADHSLVIEATAEGYFVKDILLGAEAKAANLKAARTIVNEWLQARPAAQGKPVEPAPAPEPAPQAAAEQQSTVTQPKPKARSKKVAGAS
jgi:hypothetical protein